MPRRLKSRFRLADTIPPSHGPQFKEATLHDGRRADTCQAIVERRWTLEEARQAIERARLEAALAIPDQMKQYDLIYGNRFERLLEQFPPRKS